MNLAVHKQARQNIRVRNLSIRSVNEVTILLQEVWSKYELIKEHHKGKAKLNKEQ